MYLLKNKFSVSVATNGREALAVMAKDKPHLLLTDILMPEIDGVAFWENPHAVFSAASALMLLSLSAEELIPAGHPIGRIRVVVDEVLAGLDGEFDGMYANRAGPACRLSSG